MTMVATDQAETNFLTFPDKFLKFPGISKSNSKLKPIQKYITEDLNYVKFSILFLYRLKQQFFFAGFNHLISIAPFEPSVYDQCICNILETFNKIYLLFINILQQ